jgi:HSP20 family protein
MNLTPFTRRRRHSGEEGSLAPLSSLRTDIDRLFDRFFTSPWSGLPAWPMEELRTMGPWVPMDITENDRSIAIHAELPGLDPENVQVNVSGNELIISGEKSEEKDEKSEEYCLCERRFGSFRRVIELPTTADLEKVSAEFTNGVLHVTVPKTEAARPRQIQIEAKPKKQGREVPVGQTRAGDGQREPAGAGGRR